MSDDKSKLEAAEARANEAEANMRQAAQFGKDLLDQLNDSKARNGDLEQRVRTNKLRQEHHTGIQTRPRSSAFNRSL